MKDQLTLDAVQVGRGQRLGLALVGGDALVLGLLGARHVARAAALLQVVAAAGGGLAAQRLVLGRRESGGGAGRFRRGGFTEEKDDKRSFLFLFFDKCGGKSHLKVTECKLILPLFLIYFLLFAI